MRAAATKSTFRRDYFTRANKQREQRNYLVGAIDTETIGLDGCLTLTQSYHEYWGCKARIFYTASELLQDLFSLDDNLLRETVWFSHNGEYDWRYLLAEFEKYSDQYIFVPMERANGKFFQITVYHKEKFDAKGNLLKVTVFRDSFAIYGFSLGDFTKNFAPEFVKQDIGLDYLDFDRNNSEHLEYAKNDVIGLVTAIIAFDETVYKNYGCHLKGTISSTAFQAMLRFLPEGVYHNRQTKRAEEFFRKAYYGGRVQLNCLYKEMYHDVSVFDINSSYPAQMRKGVPGGGATKVDYYVEGKPGFYFCDVFVPGDLLWPLIPHRDETGRISFPTGHFRTYITSLEIEYARSLGCEFKIIYGYYFSEIWYCFNDFVDVCERLRCEYKKKPTEMVIKLVQNSVYGKFGTKPEGKKFVFSFDDDEGPKDYTPVIDEDTGETRSNLFFKSEERDAEYMLPHYAAWITANARLALDRAIRAAGAENVLYGDTDSIHTSSEGAERLRTTDLVGSVYGQFKFEKTCIEIKYQAPKFYTYKVFGENDVKVVCKGIPKNAWKVPNVKDPNYDAKMHRLNRLSISLHEGERVSETFHSSMSMQTYTKQLMRGKPRDQRHFDRLRSSTEVHNIYGHIVENGLFRSRRIDERCAPD